MEASFFLTASLYCAGTSDTTLTFFDGGPSSEGAGLFALALGDDSIEMEHGWKTAFTKNAAGRKVPCNRLFKVFGVVFTGPEEAFSGLALVKVIGLTGGDNGDKGELISCWAWVLGWG